MLISLGPQAFIMPAPVMLVGTYDADVRPNVMAASWGGLCCSQSLMERRAFTVSIPGRDQVGVADFAGLVSGRTEDKFKALGIAPIAGEHVDAPYLEGSPVVLELLLRHTLELGSHTQFIGEIMDVKVRKDCLTADGLPDPARISALHYVPLIKEYYSGGEFATRAFAVGKTVKKQNQASSY